MEWTVAVLLVAAGAALIFALDKAAGRRRAPALVAAWLVPGAGHVLLGKWRKGLFFFALLGVTYLFGLWIVDFRAVSFKDNPFYYVGQFGSALTMFLAKVISSQKAFPRDGLPPSWFDPGLLYVCVVGLLNLVVALNVLDVKVAKASPAPAAPSAPTPEPAAASAPEKGEAPA